MTEYKLINPNLKWAGNTYMPNDEQAREEKWARFEGECADFAKSEPDGYAAVLRAVARAMKDQRELWRG